MLISDTFINRSWDLQDMHFSASIHCTQHFSIPLSEFARSTDFFLCHSAISSF